MALVPPTLLPKLHIIGGDDVSVSSNGYLQLGSTSGTNVIYDNNEIMARNNGSAADLLIQKDGGNLMLCSDEAGSVAIGVSTSSNIPSGYLLAVDGKIVVEEVLVELSGSWPDYVFAEDYNLRPIKELEKRIQENGHLPGIPSAQEIEENGILLGDMQKKMIEKIEELTLYIIQQQHEIEALKIKFESLNINENEN